MFLLSLILFERGWLFRELRVCESVAPKLAREESKAEVTRNQLLTYDHSVGRYRVYMIIKGVTKSHDNETSG